MKPPQRTEAERIAGDEDRCPECGLLSCICFDDEDYDPDDDDGWDECGMMPDGFCTLAGTEWCDWDCPRNKPSLLSQDQTDER